MDIKQLLPILLKNRLGEREQTLLKLTQNPDPAAISELIGQMYEQKTPQTDVYATFKRLIPAEMLGRIIKYFDAEGNAIPKL